MRNFKRDTAGDRNNWYGKYAIKGYSDAKNNELRPLERFEYQLVYVDICGWERVIEPIDVVSRVLIPYEETYYVQTDMWPWRLTRGDHNRAPGVVTFDDYTTTSVAYPDWHEEQEELQCDINQYRLMTQQEYGLESEDIASLMTPTDNTNDAYSGSRIIYWDEPTLTYHVDTADNTTRLGTETFWIRMRTRYPRWEFY